MKQPSPDILLHAYRTGVFPMADPQEDNEVYWYAPDPRAIIPLDAFHVPKSLRRVVRQGRFEIRLDAEFEAVMRACAAPREADEDSWISEALVQSYTALHDMGCAHSVECWRNGALVGGLYGVRQGGAFFGESMFHRVRDASKVALVHLVQHMRAGGFTLLDVQFLTPHLARFGAVEIGRERYEAMLQRALAIPADW